MDQRWRLRCSAWRARASTSASRSASGAAACIACNGDVQRLQRRRASLATATCSACNGDSVATDRRLIATATCSTCNGDMQYLQRCNGSRPDCNGEIPRVSAHICCRHGPSTCCGVINKIFTRQIEDEKLAMCARTHSDSSFAQRLSGRLLHWPWHALQLRVLGGTRRYSQHRFRL